MGSLAQVFGPEWNIWIFLTLCYLAAGAYVADRAQGAAKYYHRQYKNDKEPVVVFTALLMCIVFWPFLLARKDVNL